MQELTYEFFEMLLLAKKLHDSKFSDKYHREFDSLELCGDFCYELSYEAMGWIFEDSRSYYNDYCELETWVFIDPVIDKFCALCQLYERQAGLTEEANPYRKQLTEAIHEHLNFDSYSYNYSWYLSAADRGRKRLLFFIGTEFFNLSDVPGELLEIRMTFEELNRQLASASAEKILSMPRLPEERREAA